MPPRELLRLIRSKAKDAELGVVVQEGRAHTIVRVGTCMTTIPRHQGEDIAPGTLRAIERQLEPCLGRRWLRD